MFSSSKKNNLQSQDLANLNPKLNSQNQVKSNISVLDEFVLEIFIDFLNNEKTQYNVFEFYPRLLKFLAFRLGSKLKNSLRAKKSKSDKIIKRKINKAQTLPSDEVKIDSKKKSNLSIAPQIEGSGPSSVVEPSNRPTKLFTPGGKAAIFEEDKNFIIDNNKLNNLKLFDKSEEVFVVSLIIEQLKNMQNKLKSKEVVFKSIDDVLDFTKVKLKNLQISNENNAVKIENNFEKANVKTDNIEKSQKFEKLEIKTEKIENLETKLDQVVNQNVMNDNFSKSAKRNYILKDDVPSPSPKLFHVKVSFNASDLKSLTNTLFENVGKWQNQVRNQKSNDNKIHKITHDDLTISL
jgi:hypothetical protein